MPVLLDLADEGGLVEMLRRRIHLELEARGRLDRLACHGLADGFGIRGAGGLHGARPELYTEIRGFHRVVRDPSPHVRQLVLDGVSLPLFDETLVLGRFDRHEVVPRGKVSDERLGVDATKLLLADRERDDGQARGLQALLAELAVKRLVRV